MQLKTAISCLHYDDFLAQTLPHNLAFLPSVTVVTSPRDTATMELARHLGADLFLTDAWHLGGSLNKAHALNQWWFHSVATAPQSWLMTLDADILLFDSVAGGLADLNPKWLYGARRRMCPDEAALSDFLSGKKALDDFPLDTIPVVGGKLWGHFPQQNQAGLSGFLQLWCPAHATGLPQFPVSGSAEAYDTLFGLSFGEQSRGFLRMRDALHLGPAEVNWHGRRSPRWHEVPEPARRHSVDNLT